MTLMKILGGLFSSPKGGSKEAYWIYARCGWCGEKLSARVNLYNDLSINYGDKEGQDTYICRKILVGDQQCFRRVEIKLVFNINHKLIDREIIGGEFISAEEYEAG
jgi:hypothetical protein